MSDLYKNVLLNAEDDEMYDEDDESDGGTDLNEEDPDTGDGEEEY